MNLSEGVTGEFAVGAGKKAMYEPCMNKVHTSNVQINLCMFNSKKSVRRESNPGPLAENPATLIPLLAAQIQYGQS